MEVDDLVSERRELVKDIGGLTDGRDLIVLDDDPTVAKDTAFGVHGYDRSIVEYDDA